MNTHTALPAPREPIKKTGRDIRNSLYMLRVITEVIKGHIKQNYMYINKIHVVTLKNYGRI